MCIIWQGFNWPLALEAQYSVAFHVVDYSCEHAYSLRATVLMASLSVSLERHCVLQDSIGAGSSGLLFETRIAVKPNGVWQILERQSDAWPGMLGEVEGCLHMELSLS